MKRILIILSGAFKSDKHILGRLYRALGYTYCDNINTRLIYYYKKFDIANGLNKEETLHEYRNYVAYDIIRRIPRNKLLQKYHIWRLVGHYYDIEVCEGCFGGVKKGGAIWKSGRHCNYCNNVTYTLYTITNIRQLRPQIRFYN